MHDIIRYSTAALIGVAFACFYFGGLWLTVRRIPFTGQPWLVYFVSLLMRTAIALGGFYVVLMRGGLPLLGACLAGFIVARCVLIYCLGSCKTAGLAAGIVAVEDKMSPLDNVAAADSVPVAETIPVIEKPPTANRATT